MVDAEKIIAEIRRLKTEIQGYSVQEALDYIESYINLQEQSSLPSNLDEAAEKYSNDSLKDLGAILRVDVRNAFKAGAEWMAGQGVSWEDMMTYFDGFLFYGKDERAFMMEGNFNEGDKVIVQIRKK